VLEKPLRLITYLGDGQERLGALLDRDRQILDLAKAAALVGEHRLHSFAGMAAFIEGGPVIWDEARTILSAPPEAAMSPAKECRLLAPLPRPTQIRDCLCFPEHLRGAQRVLGERMIKAAAEPDKKRAQLDAAGFFNVAASYYDFPVYYITNRLSIVGPDTDVVWPAYSQFIDYELEWAAVIGTRGSRIARSDAKKHIFGYTIFNDWSARDEQMKVMGGAINLGPGQGKDFANGLGPCIVTEDEIPNPYALTMTARINGVETARGSTAGMHYKFEDLIEYLTRADSLSPGEIICSGTVGGGCCFESGHTLASGDQVELEVEKIGVLRNRVLAPHTVANSTGGFSEDMLSSLNKVLKR
jgi:2-keto-4-pentenoate hydratase/2-oxohepta-3-ene-1,7-dioic acid hydratase in catechol pathway